jgi:predicted enzyme related to lactoylglutathione lyase
MTPPPSQAKPAANPVTWFEVAGKDSNKLREFYGKLFGWQFNIPPDMDYGMVDAGDHGIGGGVGGGDKPHAIFYAEVANPQAAMDKIVANGGKVSTPVMDAGMVTMGLFTDPEGNLSGVYKMNQ